MRFWRKTTLPLSPPSPVPPWCARASHARPAHAWTRVRSPNDGRPCHIGCAGPGSEGGGNRLEESNRPTIVKWALCCPLAPAVPLLSPTRARQVHYLPGGGWSPLSGLVGMYVCDLWLGGLQTFVCRLGWRPGSSWGWAESVGNGRIAARPLSSARDPNGT